LRLLLPGANKKPPCSGGFTVSLSGFRSIQSRPSRQRRSARPGFRFSRWHVLDYFARFQTGGADNLAFGHAVDQDPHPLEVGHPAPIGHVVGMGNVVTGHRPFTANFANLSHVASLFSIQKAFEYMHILGKDKPNL
jgi:hypothetical protein